MENRDYSIKRNVQVYDDIYKMTIDAPPIAELSHAGQFVHIRINETVDPLLRRPFCIHRVNMANREFEVLYRIIGKGTEMLSQKQPDELITVLGPVGRGFTIDNSFDTALVVAGGMGIAPMYFLLDELIKQKKSVTLLWGAKKKGEIFSDSGEMRERGISVKYATEDGSIGHKGFITELLCDSFAAEINPAKVRGFVCGPVPMLKAVQQCAADSGIPWEASLEERMACGIGVCAGCSVKTMSGDYKLVCKDGPVMNLMEIDYND